ncbi:hypothetical protein HID58_083518, partial [Brassica napus]
QYIRKTLYFLENVEQDHLTLSYIKNSLPTLPPPPLLPSYLRSSPPASAPRRAVSSASASWCDLSDDPRGMSLFRWCRLGADWRIFAVSFSRVIRLDVVQLAYVCGSWWVSPTRLLCSLFLHVPLYGVDGFMDGLGSCILCFLALMDPGIGVGWSSMTQQAMLCRVKLLFK